MDLARWAFPTEVVFGAGAVGEAGALVAAAAARRPLVVSDRGVRAAGLLDPVAASLAAAGLAVAIHDGVGGNPSERHVSEAVAAFRSHEADALVAVGGGSVIDVAKIAALAVHHRRPLADYDDARGGGALITGPIPPIVAIPTTAGTGSEVGRSGVVTLEGRKVVIFSPRLLPRAAVLDPELTRSMPPGVTAATGYDALTHAVEAFVSRGDHPMCDGIALTGVALCARSLRRAVADGADLEARGDMLKAAMMGAVAFQKGLGACHSLAHPLSSVSGLHHGLANALCLPAVVRFNLDAGGEVERRYAEIARVLTGEARAERVAEALAALRADVGLPASLSSAGVREADLDRLVEQAFADGCHESNPRPCRREDLKQLYLASWFPA